MCIRDSIAAWTDRRRPAAPLSGLPDVEDHVRSEHHRRHAREQAVETVGEVRPVGERRDDEHHPQHRDERGQRERRDVSQERHRAGGRGDAAMVGEHQAEDREDQPDDALQDELRLGVEAQRARPADLGPVVEEADEPETDEQEHGQQTRCRHRTPEDEVGTEVAEDDRDDEDEAAHRRRAALRVVLGGTVVADELSVPASRQELDEEAGAEQGDRHRDRPSGEDAQHGAPSRSAATVSRPTPREALTSTTSPGRSPASWARASDLWVSRSASTPSAAAPETRYCPWAPTASTSTAPDAAA